MFDWKPIVRGVGVAAAVMFVTPMVVALLPTMVVIEAAKIPVTTLVVAGVIVLGAEWGLSKVKYLK